MQYELLKGLINVAIAGVETGTALVKQQLNAQLEKLENQGGLLDAGQSQAAALLEKLKEMIPSNSDSDLDAGSGSDSDDDLDSDEDS